MLYLMMAAILTMGFAACSSTDDDEEGEQPEKQKPEVPISDSDWQTVPATGGTIEKDDIALTFASGTFRTDAKVAITSVKKGEIGGQYEASPFYQISMPCTAAKPVTVKFKSADKCDDVCVVAHSRAFCMSSGQEKKAEMKYETTYADGEYTATIPAINGDVEGDEVYFTIGLGHMISYKGQSGARTRSLFDEVLQEGRVKNVTYKVRFPWWTLVKLDKTTLVQAEMKSKAISNYVEQALTKIFDLGFTLTGNKTLYIDFADDTDWGGHQVCGVPGSGGWSTWVSLGTQKLLDASTTETDIKCTVIHEVFHWVQSYYDPRSNFKKSKKEYAGDVMVMYEMGAVWIENLMNGGQLNAKWLNQAVLCDIVLEDRLGLTDIKSRMGDRYADQGYSMGPLLYYLCSSGENSAFGFDNKSVLELHEQWKAKLATKTTFEILEHWAYYTHDYGIFMGDGIDDYYMKLLSGKLVKGTNMFKLYECYGNQRGCVHVKEATAKINPFEGKIYPYGCAPKAVHLLGLKDVPLSNYNLVIKQECEGMQTYVMTANKADEKFLMGESVAKKGDSIVISGKALEALRNNDGTFDQYIFLVTTRTENYVTDKGAEAYKVTAELQKCPYEVSMISVLGHFSTIANNGNVEAYDNLGGAVQEGDGTITTTMKGKGLHIEGTATTNPMSWATYNIHISLDIDDASLIETHKSTITKLELVTDTQTEYGGITSVGKATLTAANVPMGPDNAGLRYWKGSGITGYSWYDTTYYTDKTETSSMSLVDTPGQYLEIWIHFKDGSKARVVF